MVERTEHYGGGPAAKASPFVTVAADPPGPSAAPAMPMPRGLSRIGRYHVLKTLGEGGMGVVYSAFDEELDRRVAIKVLAADIAPELRGRTRMIREAQAMAKLSHPNVVHVYEVGEVEGHVYVAMEFVRGTTFRQWLDAHGFVRGDAQRAPLRERLEIVLQAGEGLAAAHAAGIVHRDFKPENVMVADLPEGASPFGRARVLDFGLARGAGEKDEHEEKPEGWHDSTLDSRFPERAGSVLSVQLTKHGSIMGTPAYMSPEQHFGLPTDASSDQFNFCVVLYEALYGVRPFPGDNRMAIAMATRAGKIDAAPAGHEVPAKLRDIVVRGLAAEPAQRWPSMRALLDALRAAADPQRARPIWPIAVIAVLVSAVIALVVVQLRPTPDAAIPSAVESLAANARLWASRAHWVYPDATASEETALRAVAALRGLEGELDAPGETQADVLASEFAGTLARLGDQYWAAEGGRVFARDFYAQALLFDPTRNDARERCGFTPAELAELRQRAEAGDFSPAELEAADELVELAAPMLEAKDDAPPPEQIALRVAKVKKRAAKRKAERSHVAASEEPPVVAIAPTPKPSEPVAIAEPAVMPPPAPLEPAPVDTGEPEEPKDPNAAREEAKKLVADARKLKQQGKRDAALKKMFEATKVDRRFAPAWDGLRDLHFQIGAYQEAVQYGEKAVKLSPGNGQYHLRLGEAHWKLKDYASAEKEWTKAAALGVAQAKERLATLPGR